MATNQKGKRIKMDKQFIENYLEFKKECVDLQIMDLEEICKLYKIKLEQQRLKLF